MSDSNRLKPLTGERQSKETDAAVTACNDWLRMGSGRTLSGLIDKYQQQSTFQSGFKPPTSIYSTLRTWSSNFKWPDRAAEYDATWEQRKNTEREAVMAYGLALDYERVRELYRLAEFLKAQIYERDPETGKYPNIWVPDVKSIGGGDSAERVDIERFNPAIVDQYRKVMEDIAKEVGGRALKQDISGGLKLEWVDALEDDDEIGIGENELPPTA